MFPKYSSTLHTFSTVSTKLHDLFQGIVVYQCYSHSLNLVIASAFQCEV